MTATESTRAGYRKTDIGEIPDDWQDRDLSALASMKSGVGITASSLNDAAEYICYGGNGHRGRTKEFTHNGRHALIGRQGALCGNIQRVDGKFFASEHAIVVTAKSSVDIDWLAIVLDKKNLNQFAESSAQPGLSVERILKLRIATPPKKTEQRAIASALDNVDSLIDALGALIAKKRDIKQAAMQQLLTGRTRLPGFTGQWAVKRLGDRLKVRHGRSQRGVVAENGHYPILGTGGEIGRTDEYIYDEPSVLIGRKGTIDAPQFLDTPFWTIDTLFFTEISPAEAPKFIFYKFLHINWRNYNEASGVPSLSASTIENIEIASPDLAEQAAIAAVLTDMDAEIAALEARRDKTRAIKQGMMQELLTGRIRLV